MFTLLLPGCAAAINAPAVIAVTVQANGQQQLLQIQAGQSVQHLLEAQGVEIGPLDRVDPPLYSLLTRNTTIQIIRVREEFENQEKVIPFEHQTVKNESLPQDQTLRIQPGENGKQQITYRKVYEDGVLKTNTIFKVTTLAEAKPEIIMVGVQTPFSSTPVSGRLAYLTAGNAWIIEQETGRRRPIITSGDLDGRVFSLSPDGTWLLFTRKAPAEQKDTINSLWAVSAAEENARPLDLHIQNIVHYAGWVPGAILTITYSTVEPRSAPPGWQANNDLQLQSFTASGATLRSEKLIDANSGGIYGWWGTSYSWSPDGSQLAYARPDSVGLVDQENATYIPLLDIVPLQTRSDWAWVPGLTWSQDNQFLYTVNHVPRNTLSAAEESPLFDITAIPLKGGASVAVMPRTGMFAYPLPSPQHADGGYTVAYLQAVYPEQSQNSAYQLFIMDRDGSNRQLLFPADAYTGLDPQQVIWGPEGENEKDQQIGVIYAGNLWFINVDSSQAQQVTGDGSISRIDWK